MRDKLTSKQEGYAQDRASGLTQSAAYRNNYGTSNMSAKTVWEEASRLDKHPKVSERILELQATTEAALAVKRLWTMDSIIEAAEENLDGAREGKQFGSANRALELIGRLTGLVGGKHQEPHVPITRVIINLAPGVEPPADQIVEAAEYQELPQPSFELSEGMVELPPARQRRASGR